jgi:hypothetical protein
MTSLDFLAPELDAIRKANRDRNDRWMPILFKPWAEKSKDQYVEFLRNHYVLAEHIHVNIGLVLEKSPQISIQLRKVVLIFGQEELGHELQVAKDVRNLESELRPNGWHPQYAMAAMIAHCEYMIRKHPISYLGHCYSMESLGADIKEHLKAGKTLGYPENAMLWLSTHADINDAHSDFMRDAILKYTANEEEAAAILRSATVTGILYSDFLRGTFGSPQEQ